VWHASVSVRDKAFVEWSEHEHDLVDARFYTAFKDVGDGEPWDETDPGPSIKARQMKRFLSEAEITILPSAPVDIRSDLATVVERLGPVASAVGLPVDRLMAFEGLLVL